MRAFALHYKFYTFEKEDWGDLNDNVPIGSDV